VLIGSSDLGFGSDRLAVRHSVPIQTKKHAPDRKQDCHDRNRREEPSPSIDPPSRQGSTSREQSERNGAASQQLSFLPNLLESRCCVLSSCRRRNSVFHQRIPIK
jgi:hypothetical protein